MKKYERNIDERKKSFLIIHTNGMGDFLMFTPAYKEILKKYPNCEIDFFITNKNVREIISKYPNICTIYSSSLKISDIFNHILKIRKNKYDYLIVTTGGKTWKANFLSFLLKAKIKVGEHIYFKSLVYTHSIKRYNFTHFVENNIRLVRTIIDFPVSTSYKLWFPLKKRKYLFEKGKKIVIGIHPGCQEAYKERRWPKFKELIEKIVEFYPCIEILIFLGKEDLELKNNFLKLKQIRLVENKGIEEVADLLKNCNLFINSDSGLGHLYTCFNENIISIFGPNQLGLNQELRTGPYSKKAKIIKIRGMKENYYKEITTNGVLKCLEDIDIEEILKFIKSEMIRKYESNNI